ncbi:MAG: hypothetical protein WBB28_20365 [Crinalium sp.]
MTNNSLMDRYTQPEPKTRAFSQAIAKIKKMLIKYPDNLSVYYYLGLLHQAVEEIDIAIEVWENAYNLITSSLPKPWHSEYVMHDLVIDNYDTFAIANALNGAYLQKSDSINSNSKNLEQRILRQRLLTTSATVGLQLLNWCYRDGSGVRERVVEAQLKLGDYQGALEVCSKYLDETQTNFENKLDDTSPGIRYGRVLAAINLEMKEAQKWLKAAIETRPLIAKIILTDEPSPIKIHDYYVTSNGYNEAYYYWLDMEEEWRKCPKAMKLLRSHSHLADEAIEHHKQIWGSALLGETGRPFPEIYCWPD